jgi:hypothetical protein
MDMSIGEINDFSGMFTPRTTSMWTFSIVFPRKVGDAEVVPTIDRRELSNNSTTISLSKDNVLIKKSVYRRTDNDDTQNVSATFVTPELMAGSTYKIEISGELVEYSRLVSRPITMIGMGFSPP